MARFDVPKDAVYATATEKIVSREVVERTSDGENYDDVVAEVRDFLVERAERRIAVAACISSWRPGRLYKSRITLQLWWT